MVAIERPVLDSLCHDRRAKLLEREREFHLCTASMMKLQQFAKEGEETRIQVGATTARLCDRPVDPHPVLIVDWSHGRHVRSGDVEGREKLSPTASRSSLRVRSRCEWCESRISASIDARRWTSEASPVASTS